MHPTDDVIMHRRHIIAQFENTPPTAPNYLSRLNDIRDRVLKRTMPFTYAGQPLRVQAIDQDGKACSGEGNALIQRIAEKFSRDFRRLAERQMTDSVDRLFSRASWLYKATPVNVTAYVKQVLTGDFMAARWGRAVEAASRFFVEVDDFQLLFECIARRARVTWESFESFPIQTARGICRVLMFRQDGEKGLSADMARMFANRALERLQQEQKTGSFSMLFFQVILLVLYLLRFRRSDPLCFDARDAHTFAMFHKVMETMDMARAYFSDHNQDAKALRVAQIAEGFEKYLYYEGTEDLLTVLGEFAGDMR